MHEHGRANDHVIVTQDNCDDDDNDDEMSKLLVRSLAANSHLQPTRHALTGSVGLLITFMLVFRHSYLVTNLVTHAVS